MDCQFIREFTVLSKEFSATRLHVADVVGHVTDDVGVYADDIRNDDSNVIFDREYVEFSVKRNISTTFTKGDLS